MQSSTLNLHAAALSLNRRPCLLVSSYYNRITAMKLWLALWHTRRWECFLFKCVYIYINLWLIKLVRLHLAQGNVLSVQILPIGTGFCQKTVFVLINSLLDLHAKWWCLYNIFIRKTKISPLVYFWCDPLQTNQCNIYTPNRFSMHVEMCQAVVL